MTTIAPPEPLPITTLANGVLMITLEHPDRPLVILDQALLKRLDRTLDELPADATAVYVQSGDSKVFIAGADLKEIDALTDDQLLAYLSEGVRIFERLSTLPCPSVALVNGATLGGGLELAMHCTAIVASRVNAKGKPYPIGLPEAGLGLCPAWGGTQYLPGRIAASTAIPATATGTPFSIADVPEGLVDAFADTPADLVATADQWLAATPDPTHPGTVQQADREAILAAIEQTRADAGDHAAALAVCDAIRTGLDRDLAGGLEAERRLLVALRQTEDTRAKLTAFFQGAR
ncbi:MAG: enoyl-CoA hydratase/isomerase family protein [Phycisphaerales bacterium]|nr:enoyl-CoA hydratase/isomerase family protein [Phycisphaerales bacterium]